MRAVVESLPDTVPSFKEKDVKRDRESVMKFLKAVIVKLKPAALQEIELFRTGAVDSLYGT